jgi:hypothetical protein
VNVETTKLGVKLQFKPPPGFGKAASGVLGVIGMVGAIGHLLPDFPSAFAVQVVDGVFCALAFGWIARSVVHGCIGYFLATTAVGAPRRRLQRASTLNALFAVFWLSGAILLLQHPDALLTLGAAALASILIFVLSLWTLTAARQARRDRGSEWMRRRLRDPLEPGVNTPLGWLLITLIDWRSAPSKLSTFVAGNLALLAICVVTMAPAALHPSTDGGSQDPSASERIPPPAMPAPAEPECTPRGTRVDWS